MRRHRNRSAAVRAAKTATAVLAATGLVLLSPGTSVADGSGGLSSGSGSGGSGGGSNPLSQVTGQLTGGSGGSGGSDPAKQLQDTVDQLTSGSGGSGGSDPAKQLGDTVDQLTDSGSGSGGSGGGSSTGSDDVPAPSSDDDSTGHETTDPTPPDHASSDNADVNAGGQDVANQGSDDATVRRDDSTKADSTLLSLGGNEVLGAHADSRKNKQQDHAPTSGALDPVCVQSDGAACLDVLYSDAYATDDGTTSHSRSRSGVAAVCLGGSAGDTAQDCSGPLRAGVATSNSEANRNQRTGRTRAHSESSLADVCLRQSGECALSADAVQSNGRADSRDGGRGTASRDSTILRLGAMGQSTEPLKDPMGLALPPGTCPDDTTSLVCLFVNQGETYLGQGVAGTAQDALDLGVLPGNDLLQVNLGHTETLVHNDGGEAPNTSQNTGGATSPTTGGGNARFPNTGANAGGAGLVDDGSGFLPNTGGPDAGLLALGLLALSGGGFLLARYWRRTPAAS